MEKTNILITSAGKRVALTRHFKETLSRFFPKAKVYTTDMHPDMAPAAYVSDRCFAVPCVKSPEYPDILLSLCREHGVGMVVPTIDTEIMVLAALKERFAKEGIHVIVGDTSFVGLCRDKRNTGAFFESRGIRVPHSIDKHHPTFPLFAKPYDGSLSTNLHFITKPEELTDDILHDDKLLFMEYIDRKVYKEYTVDMYFGRDHEVKSIVPRERIEIRAGEINKGRTAKNAIVPYLKERLAHTDGCVGCICMQLFFHPDTRDIVGIEVNPRFGGGYPLTYMSGANYPELLIREYLLGERIAYNDSWTDGKLMLRYDDAVFA